MNANDFMREIGRLEGRMEMTERLELMTRRLFEIEGERRIESWQEKTTHIQGKLEAHERRQAAREQARKEILFRGALQGIGISDRIACRLAEDSPVLAGEELTFPVRELVSLKEAIDRLRVVEPYLFEEPVIAEPHDDEIEAFRRDRWGDVPE